MWYTVANNALKGVQYVVRSVSEVASSTVRDRKESEGQTVMCKKIAMAQYEHQNRLDYSK